MPPPHHMTHMQHAPRPYYRPRLEHEHRARFDRPALLVVGDGAHRFTFFRARSPTARLELGSTVARLDVAIEAAIELSLDYVPDVIILRDDANGVENSYQRGFLINTTGTGVAGVGVGAASPLPVPNGYRTDLYWKQAKAALPGTAQTPALYDLAACWTGDGNAYRGSGKFSTLVRVWRHVAPGSFPNAWEYLAQQKQTTGAGVDDWDRWVRANVAPGDLFAIPNDWGPPPGAAVACLQVIGPSLGSAMYDSQSGSLTWTPIQLSQHPIDQGGGGGGGGGGEFPAQKKSSSGLGVFVAVSVAALLVSGTAFALMERPKRKGSTTLRSNPTRIELLRYPSFGEPQRFDDPKKHGFARVVIGRDVFIKYTNRWEHYRTDASGLEQFVGYVTNQKKLERLERAVVKARARRNPAAKFQPGEQLYLTASVKGTGFERGDVVKILEVYETGGEPYYLARDRGAKVYVFESDLSRRHPG